VTATPGSALARLAARMEAVDSMLCVGLDNALERLPDRFRREPRPQATFARWIIDATHETAAAYKVNTAFHEARGAAGWDELAEVVNSIRAADPGLFVILDAKRADIADTNAAYASAIFDELGADAVTVHPYLGSEAMQPFLTRADKAVIVLCRTSNPGAGELQDLAVEGMPLWEAVAVRVRDAWDARGNCMLVMGATYPDELRRARELCPEMPFLVPGVGAQGGDLEAVVRAGLDAHGRGLLINASRAIAGADDPAGAASSLRDAIRAATALAGVR